MNTKIPTPTVTTISTHDYDRAVHRLRTAAADPSRGTTRRSWVRAGTRC